MKPSPPDPAVPGADPFKAILDLTLGPASTRIWVGEAAMGERTWPDAIILEGPGDLNKVKFSESVRRVALAWFPAKTHARDLDQFLAGLLASLPEGADVAMLSGAPGLITRQVILAHGQPEWLLWLGPEDAWPLGVHPKFKPVLLVFRKVESHAEARNPLRLVDLEDLDEALAVERVAMVAARMGGEGPGFIISRTARLDQKPWNFHRFSQIHERAVKDLEELGSTSPLGTLADWIGQQIHRVRDGRLLKKVPDGRLLKDVPQDVSVLSEGELRCFDGRSIGDSGVLFGYSHTIPRGAVRETAWLRPGDILIRRIGRIGQPLRVALVRPEDLPGVALDSLIVVRPKSGEPVTPFLPGYLRSERVAKLLAAEVVPQDVLILSVQTISSLPVPLPKPEVLEALDRLEADRARHQAWADELEAKRSELFLSPSYREAVPDLLHAVNVSADRVRSAQDAGTLDFLVRERFPHPISLRREHILRTPHGEDRLKKIRECAEILISLLATLAMTDLSLQPRFAWSGFLRRDTNGTHTMDFGKAFNILDNHLAAYAKHPNPLVLDFPQFTRLEGLREGSVAPVRKALERIYYRRNKASHLIREAETRIPAVSEQHSSALDLLLECCSLLTELPLVRVEDYWYDPFENRREAEFEFLTGISTVFRRERREVSVEVPKGKLGFLAEGNRFHPVPPFISLRPCKECGRSEIFMFSRLTRTRLTMVSMEQGHEWETTDEEERARFARFLGIG